ncbi:tyrosine-protein kinase hopscotch [Episyrphus balteatus]|uniref:tyrosine-protein kinase hopscotch n=1 Tax=Episyrphus balteatus TaxID=286459 RepID=UPI0024858BC5|nr:tyrosine-protein kinase hopscotch [Episyrphus balteatus]
MAVIQVFLYQTNEFSVFPYNSSITCEDICILCCKSLNILPAARLLFGLRVADTEEWLFPCQIPKLSVKYEFRMRFKVPELDSLYAIDPNAYEYLYLQIRYDMVNDRISEIRYPLKKDNVVGLGVVDMYIDYIENKGTVESIERNYKDYLPPQIVKKHKFFAKNIIRNGFQAIRGTTQELKYVKSSYMHTFAGLAPNYLREYFNATVQRMPDGEDAADRSGRYPVTVDLDLFGDEDPSIKVSLKFKKQWVMITELENLHALYREDEHRVRLDLNGPLKDYYLEFNRPYELTSFMSYVSGYFRLMTKWMFDPCVDFVTPSLMELKRISCHGPVGGEFSYAKIRELGKGCGSYIVRQCELEYDTYYIDIVTKRKQPETFKITRNGEKWTLHMNGITCSKDLTDLVSKIPTDSKSRLRITPSDYDKPLLLLICLPRNRLQKTTDNEIKKEKLQENRPQIFDPKKDLQWYIHSVTRSVCGRMTCRLAEWIQPSGVKNVKVTLKVLNYESDFGAFMELSNTWSRIYSTDFLKMYGLTLTTPYTMIMENSKYGPLNKFLLSSKNKVTFQNLLDVTNGLVRGVAFMQEKRIYHGQIRCSSLMVTSFDPDKNILIAKISDPGIRRTYDPTKDLPWIPMNFHSNPANNQLDLYSELWAFATTVWEIFARAQPIQHLTAQELSRNYRIYGAILEIPDEWPEEIRVIIMNGWQLNDGVRFDKMDILSKLNVIKRQLSSTNSTMNPPNMDDDNKSLTLSTSSNGTENACQNFPNGDIWPDNYFDDTRTVQIIPEGKLIRDKKIGEGHYGKVFRGELHYYNQNSPITVAIKVLKHMDQGCIGIDFDREINIMQGLNHPNIVKIITSTYDEPMSIVMEYLKCGSFDVYLSSQKPNLTNERLLMFALDIAKGMEYLETKGIIHRDLAARNILVDGESVKISDFGLAQHANNKGYYVSQNVRKIPIRWYALESLLSNKFSSSSDVWSYGVTLFEIFTRGEEPNLDGVELNGDEFISRLEKGDRLHKPKLCPQIVYDKLMVPSWHKVKEKRPTFTEIIKIIHFIQNESGELI